MILLSNAKRGLAVRNSTNNLYGTITGFGSVYDRAKLKQGKRELITNSVKVSEIHFADGTAPWYAYLPIFWSLNDIELKSEGAMSGAAKK